MFPRHHQIIHWIFLFPFFFQPRFHLERGNYSREELHKQPSTMISNDIKSSHENEFTNEYYTPEYITVTVSEPITHEESGKKVYTSYKLTTVVRDLQIRFVLLLTTARNRRLWKICFLIKISISSDHSKKPLIHSFFLFPSVWAPYLDYLPRIQTERILRKKKIQGIRLATKSSERETQ